MSETFRSERFKKNRYPSFYETFSSWKYRKRSGIMRLIERILIGANISDLLGHNGEQIEVLCEVSDQFIQRSEYFGSKYLIISRVRVHLYSGLIVLNNGFILNSFLSHWEKLIHGGGLASEYNNTRNSRVSRSGVWASVASSPYYYHFLIEEIGRALIARKVDAEVRIAISSSSPAWAYELLNLFEFKYEEFHENAIQFEKFIAIEAGNSDFSNEILTLNSCVPDIVDSSLTKVGPNILILRKGLERDNPELNNILSTFLTKYSFVEIDLGVIPIKDQMAIFHNAKIIVALHGGALANLVWCKQNAKVLEIVNHEYRTNDYQRISSKLSLDYYSIVSKDPEKIILEIQSILEHK
jgi:hypothetical protein